MNLRILFEVVMYYVIIGGMTCLGHHDKFFYGECMIMYGYILERTYVELRY